MEYKQQVGMKPQAAQRTARKIKRTQIDIAELNDQDSILEHSPMIT